MAPKCFKSTDTFLFVNSVFILRTTFVLLRTMINAYNKLSWFNHMFVQYVENHSKEPLIICLLTLVYYFGNGPQQRLYTKCLRYRLCQLNTFSWFQRRISRVGSAVWDTNSFRLSLSVLKHIVILLHKRE